MITWSSLISSTSALTPFSPCIPINYDDYDFLGGEHAGLPNLTIFVQFQALLPQYHPCPPLSLGNKKLYICHVTVFSPQQVQFPPVPAWRIWRALYCLLVIILHIAVEVLLEDVEGSSSSLILDHIIGSKCSKKILFFPLYCKIWFDAPWAEDYLNFTCQSQYLKFGTPLPNSR